MHVLDDLEHFAEASQDPVALSSVREARSGLDKLIGKMDSLESGFDRIAERSCEAPCIHLYVRLQLTSGYAVCPVLSASRLLTHRRRCELLRRSLPCFPD